MDGDGDLDLAVGNDAQPNRLYRNDGGTLTTSAVWASVEASYTAGVAWGDLDGDGDLDLAVGNSYGPNRLYRNDGGALTASAAWSSAQSDTTYGIAWGDVDGDGDLDLAGGNSGSNWLYLNGRDGRTLPGSLPLVQVARPGANANLYSAAIIWAGPVVPITYTPVGSTRRPGAACPRLVLAERRRPVAAGDSDQQYYHQQPDHWWQGSRI